MSEMEVNIHSKFCYRIYNQDMYNKYLDRVWKNWYFSFHQKHLTSLGNLVLESGR